MGGTGMSKGEAGSNPHLFVKTNGTLPEIALGKISHSDVYQWTQKVLDCYKVPVCFLALESREGMYLKGRHGIETPFANFPTICRHEERRELPIIVCDARQHFQYRFDPFVDGPPYARFYVGAPVMLPGNRCIGTLCIMDSKPRDYFSLRQCEFLVECGKHIGSQVAMKAQSLTCMTSDSLEPLGRDQQSPSESVDSLTSAHLNGACTKDSLASIEEDQSVDEGDGASTEWLSEHPSPTVHTPSNDEPVPEDLHWSSSSEPPQAHEA